MSSRHRMINHLQNIQNHDAWNETILKEDLRPLTLPNKRFASQRQIKEVNRTPLFDAILKHKSNPQTDSLIKNNVECDLNENYQKGIKTQDNKIKNPVWYNDANVDDQLVPEQSFKHNRTQNKSEIESVNKDQSQLGKTPNLRASLSDNDLIKNMKIQNKSIKRQNNYENTNQNQNNVRLNNIKLQNELNSKKLRNDQTFYAKSPLRAVSMNKKSVINEDKDESKYDAMIKELYRQNKCRKHVKTNKKNTNNFAYEEKDNVLHQQMRQRDLNYRIICDK